MTDYPDTPAGWADQARDCLTLAHQLLPRAGYRPIRIDQWEHPETKVLVETGYTYGETRLTVHAWKGDRPEVTDLRVTGPSGNDRFRTFRQLANV